MLHYLSKIIWLFLMPSSLIGVIFLTGLIASIHFKTFSRRLIFCAAFLFVATGFLPIGYNAVHYWETQYPYPVQLPTDVDGIIVLGGALEAELSHIHGTYSLNESGERLTHFITLARQYPKAKLVFAGGSGHFIPSEETEASYVHAFLESVDFSTERVLFEDESRNTFENAAFAKKLAQPAETETWLLITSAFHMPRSVAVFTSQGWDVVPVPVDFKTGAHYKIRPSEITVLKNLRLIDIGAKEAIGLLAYKLTGKIQ